MTNHFRHRPLRASTAGWLLILGLALAGSVPYAVAQTSQQPASPPAAGVAAAPPVRVPVRIGGQDVIYLLVDVGGMPAAERARRTEEILQQVVADRSVTDLTVRLEEVDNVTRLVIGSYPLVTVTEPDAAAIGVSRQLVARAWARELERALRAERALYSPEVLLRSVLKAVGASLLLAAVVWTWRRSGRLLQKTTSRWLDQRLERLRTLQIAHRSAESVKLLVEQTVRVVRFLGFVIIIDVYVTFVLSMFPWTRFIGNRLLELIIVPLFTVWNALIGYLPNAFFLLFIGIVALYLSRFVNILFDSIADGRLTLPGFSPDWAGPTFKAVRAVIFAFALVAAFPYLPGSGSPALAGVSVLAGVLVSLAASSSLSNMVAGLVLTYSGAFKVGDRVQVGGTVGDVVERGLLATRVRTPKNEDVVVPNGVVLGGQIVNYSSMAKTRGLILHTYVTIGYDAPWRKVHELLLEAAGATRDVLDYPAPFVLQTGLHDFFVTYEINVYVNSAEAIPFIYSDLHANIQDRFNDAGVEIMSPHFAALRDGNATSIPEAYRGVRYQAPTFGVRVSREGDAVPMADAARTNQKVST